MCDRLGAVEARLFFDALVGRLDAFEVCLAQYLYLDTICGQRNRLGGELVGERCGHAAILARVVCRHCVAHDQLRLEDVTCLLLEAIFRLEYLRLRGLFLVVVDGGDGQVMTLVQIPLDARLVEGGGVEFALLLSGLVRFAQPAGQFESVAFDEDLIELGLDAQVEFGLRMTRSGVCEDRLVAFILVIGGGVLRGWAAAFVFN